MALLPEAIESCYKVFSDVLKPREIPACPCCIESIHPKTLLSKRLRDLSASDLFSYHAAVFNTVGDTSDFFYFLPRLLELSSQFPNTYLSPEILGRALATTQITTWRKDLLEALMDFLNAIFLNLLEQEESGDAINSWLCAVCKMGLDPKPFLSILETSPSRVLEFYLINARKLSRQKLTNPFWELPDKGHDQIVTWFGGKAVGDIVLEAFGIELYYALGENPSAPQ